MTPIHPSEKMMIHLTGRRVSDLPHKQKALKFPIKVRYTSSKFPPLEVL